MRPINFNLDATDFDYSSYELKLQEITSIELTHLSDLHSSLIPTESNSFSHLALSYFSLIERILKEYQEEV